MENDLISRQDAIDALKEIDLYKNNTVGQLGVLKSILAIELLPSAQPVGYVHIDDVYRLISGHSNYHGDNILAALTCLAEGKEVPNPITVLDTQQETFEWCHDCKEYDQEQHCCHRWSQQIRKTIEELEASYPQEIKDELLYWKERAAKWERDYYTKTKKGEPERKKGEWCHQNDDYYDWYECSECGYGDEGEMVMSREFDVRTNFCPNCGADMRKPKLRYGDEDALQGGLMSATRAELTCEGCKYEKNGQDLCFECCRGCGDMYEEREENG